MKDFLIIAPLSVMWYKDIKDDAATDRIRMGVTLRGWTSKFYYRNGNPFILSNGMWLTSLLVPEQYPPRLVLTETYDEERYPRYDDCDAIEVPRVQMIPKDYDGKMGVPFSFYNKWNREQFEIVDSRGTPHINGRRLFNRLIIRKK